MNMNLKFSPSLNHTAVMNEREPEMSFRGGIIESWQQTLRNKLVDLLGDRPSRKLPCNPRSLWKKKTPYGTIEKIVFQTDIECDVPAYLCLPHDALPPYDCFICLQGHSTGMHNSVALDRDTEMETIKIEGDRDFAIGCMKRGLAAFCIEQRALGQRDENVQKKNGNFCEIASMQALLLGRTIIGERIHDVDCAIDLLEARGDIRMSTLGIMGNSGGGTTTLFAAAVLDRIQIAMPSCYFCTFRASLMSIYHCSCNYIPGLLKFAEMADVLGLFAPRPLIIVAGREDEIFPIEGVRAAYEKIKAIYAAAGAEDHCHLVIGCGGHRFYADDAWPVALASLKKIKSKR